MGLIWPGFGVKATAEVRVGYRVTAGVGVGTRVTDGVGVGASVMIRVWASFGLQN